MIETIRQFGILLRRSKKAWIIPLVILLCVLALIVIGAQVAPLPVFVYPLI